jgi:hypothetical protein
VADDSNILNAKTIDAFLGALNTRYQLDLPTGLPSNSPFLEFWQQTPIQVEPDGGENVLFTASGDLHAIPFAFSTAIKARVILQVFSTGSG